jgi:transposase
MRYPPSLSVGIDVSKATLDIAILTTKGVVLSKTIPNETTAIEKLLPMLSSHNITSKTPVVIESTGSLHWLVCLLLTEHHYTVHLINPLLAKKYQKASIRDTKTDSIDAIRLAEIGRLERNLPVFFDTRELLSKKRYHSLLAKLIKVKQQLTVAYNDAQYAGESIGISLDLTCIEACLTQMKEAIEILKRMITEHPSDQAVTLATIPGVSLFQAVVLLTAVEGRTFQTRDQLVAFFGLDVRQRQSGMWTGRQTLSKRGNAFYRHILFQLGWSLQRNNPEYHAYYEHLYKERNKHYYTALLATARKFLRYMFTLLPPSHNPAS